jgi:hypothetical protein
MIDGENIVWGILEWCLECEDYKKKCGGVTHPALCPKMEPEGMDD